MLGMFGSMAMAAAAMRAIERRGGKWDGDMPLMSVEDRAKVQTTNLSPEDAAERDRPVSRQERRQLERLCRKGRIF